jgi:hypothetical protein
MSERSLPSAKLVRPVDYRHGDRSSYDVIGTGSDNEGILLGQVIRDYGWGSLPWNAYLAVEHPKYGPGVRHLESSPFSTRQKALIAVLRACQARQAEELAHAIVRAIRDGVEGAEKWAAHQLAINPDVPLTDSGFYMVDSRPIRGFVLDASDAELKGLKRYGEFIVRRQLKGEEELRLPSIESVTRRRRLIELELERRQKQAQDELIPSGDYREEDRCQAFAHQGTSEGVCDTVLDQHGNCRYMDNHIEEA